MAGRMQAVWRILGLVYLATIGGIVLTITGAAGFVFMIIDVIMQLIFGGNGYGGGKWLKRVWGYGLSQVKYILFGEGSFPIIP